MLRLKTLHKQDKGTHKNCMWWSLNNVINVSIWNFVLQTHLRQIGIFCLNFTAQCSSQQISISLASRKIVSYTIRSWLSFIGTTINTSGKITNYFVKQSFKWSLFISECPGNSGHYACTRMQEREEVPKWEVDLLHFVLKGILQ